MKIQHMFHKDIDRPINGVIKVMQTDNENRKQELEEYVITRELQKHFGQFYDHYEDGITGATDKMGVWISGFFGSGKSHFLKILSYLLANEEVGGKHAVDYFADKFDYDPLRYELIRRISTVPTEVVLFNIDAKSPMGKDQDAILRVFSKVFYEHCGYYGDDMKIAAFERFLDRQGWLNAFKEVFQQINGDSWEMQREAFVFWEEDVVEALLKTTTLSEQAARNWFNGSETIELSIDKFAREVNEYIASKAPNFHLIFLVDEIGQYIGDNSGLMLNLQTVVEELGSKCGGRVWVIVTSQEDIDSVTHVKGNDFSKIQGRFNTRLSLSSASVDEVIKKRILAKNEEAVELLRLLYQQNAASMRNLFGFSQGTTADLKGYGSESEFVEVYPFVPYQFRLLQEVLVQVRKHGSSGKHLSGGERSMLSAFQEAAQMVEEQDETAFVPFCRFYDTINTFLDGAVRRVIDRAARAAADGNGLKAEDVDVFKLLFLVRYVEGVAGNVENLTTLMISNIYADKITMRRAIQESLNRLVQQNYVSRNGETYAFLTDEEQDVNRDIRSQSVDSTDVTRRIGEMVFGDLYAINKLRYKNLYDFPFDQIVDDGIIGMQRCDIKLRIVTMASDLSEAANESRLLLMSGAGNEAIVRLSNEYNYYQEIEEILKIDKYVKKQNLSQLPTGILTIIRNKQAEVKDRNQSIATLLREAILKGAFFIAGDRVAIRGSSVKDTLDQVLERLIETVYSKLNYVSDFAHDDKDILRILSEHAQQGMEGVELPNARALQDMEQYLTVQASSHMTVIMARLQERYKKAPYGWREIDVAAQVARLMRQQKVQLMNGGQPLAMDDRRAADCLRKRTELDRTIVKQKVRVSDVLLRKALEQTRELFDTLDVPQDEMNLCQDIQARLEDMQKQVSDVLAKYTGDIAYPGKAVAETGRNLLGSILLKKGDSTLFIKAYTDAQDDLLDFSEDFAEVAFFFKNQIDIFSSSMKLCQNAERERMYFDGEEAALAAVRTMREILRLDKPYRRIAELPTLKQTVQQAYERINQSRMERVKETLVQTRGDVHTLVKDHPELREDVRRIDAELDARQQAALQATNPTDLDAMITQIITYGQMACRKLEQKIAAEAQITAGQSVAAVKAHSIRRYDVLPPKRLSTTEDVDAYAEALRHKLLKALKEHQSIQLI